VFICTGTWAHNLRSPWLSVTACQPLLFLAVLGGVYYWLAPTAARSILWSNATNITSSSSQFNSFTMHLTVPKPFQLCATRYR
jgi:hypothetical protein